MSRSIQKLFDLSGRTALVTGSTSGLGAGIATALAAAGAQREEAYYWVQRNALKSWDESLDFRELVKQDPDISRTITPEQIEKAFDVRTQLKNVDRIFERLPFAARIGETRVRRERTLGRGRCGGG